MSNKELSFPRKVTLETVDSAIKQWFDFTVDSHVDRPNGDRVKVPVNWSSGERWISARQKKGIRDDNGVLILPIISIRRSNIDRDPSMSMFGTETPFIQVAKRISKKTNDVMNLDSVRLPSQKLLSSPVFDVYMMPFPDRVILTYEIQVQAQFITQMNSILGKVFNSLDTYNSFVAPFDNSGRHPKTIDSFDSRNVLRGSYVVGFIDGNLNDSGNLEEFTDQERIVRWSTSIRVPSVLWLDVEGERPAMTVKRTSYRFNFSDENVVFVDNPEDIDKIFGK